MAKVKIPYGVYTKEFREDAIRLVIEGGLSDEKAPDRLSMPKSTLERWIKAVKQGKLDEINRMVINLEHYMRPATKSALRQIRRPPFEAAGDWKHSLCALAPSLA